MVGSGAGNSVSEDGYEMPTAAYGVAGAGAGAVATYQLASDESSMLPLAALRSTNNLASRALLDEWLQLATLPSATSGLTGGACKQHLLACNTGAGTFCFRPSSKDTRTVVMCVLVDDASVAHIRIRCAPDGSVEVLDLAPEPIPFQTFDASLNHFADPAAQPNNTVPITGCLAIPDTCFSFLLGQQRARAASVSVQGIEGIVKGSSV